MADEQVQLKVPNVLEDPSIRAVARTYSVALLDAAANTNVDELLDEYRSLVADVLDTNPDLERLFQSKIIGQEEKKNLIERAIVPHASPVFANFLQVLAEHDRLDLIRAALAELELVHQQRSGHRRVTINSATPLNDEAQQKIYNRLNELLPFEPAVEVKVDPTVLGGLVIQIGDTVYDSSLRSRVTQLREQFRERYLHEIQSGRDRFSSAEGN